MFGAFIYIYKLASSAGRKILVAISQVKWSEARVGHARLGGSYAWPSPIVLVELYKPSNHIYILTPVAACNVQQAVQPSLQLFIAAATENDLLTGVKRGWFVNGIRVRLPIFVIA